MEVLTWGDDEEEPDAHDDATPPGPERGPEQDPGPGADATPPGPERDPGQQHGHGDDDTWVTVEDTAKGRPPGPAPSPPASGLPCRHCGTVVMPGAAACPVCLRPPGTGAGQPAEPAAGALRLVFGGAGRCLEVPPGAEVHLGRSRGWAPETAEFLSEATVSARHATVSYASDGTAWVTEVAQGATNGTRLNRRVLVPGQRERLRNGDTVELGPRVDFTVRLHGTAEENDPEDPPTRP
ncbi:FHA domain-containing protein [Streptomyces sp. NPDC046931]|uniref:FHA domain-containing protein n=1 Tax=Streptomyces sp. NPDC046931 TaxID=3154806 RepID=UPI0034071710